MSKETRTKLTCDACGLEIMQREDLDAPDPEEDLLVGWITVNGALHLNSALNFYYKV